MYNKYLEALPPLKITSVSFLVSGDTDSNDRTFSKLRKARKYMRALEKDNPVIFKVTSDNIHVFPQYEIVKMSYGFIKNYR